MHKKCAQNRLIQDSNSIIEFESRKLFFAVSCPLCIAKLTLTINWNQYKINYFRCERVFVY